MTRPVKSIKYGAVEAAIFENQTSKGPMKKVVLSKRYRTAQGEWASTSSLDLNDLPKASLALEKAFEFLLVGNGPDSGEAGGEE
jgi:hypothetical protein